jgi:hypothetical protein
MLKTRFLIIACAAVLVISAGVFNGTEAQGSDPTTWPLVESSHIEYLGAFRLPSNTVNGHDFSFSFGRLAFNPANQSLYVSSWHKRVAEVTIPTPVMSSTISGLPVAAFMQGFQDPSENHWTDISTESTNFGGMLKYNNKLVVSGYIYYDAAHTQRVSHFTRSPNLTTPSFSGFSAVWQPEKSGFVSGYMSPLQTPWHSLLGGPALTGNCCLSIIGRTSFGPSAFAFDPNEVGVSSVVPAQPLVYYDQAHPTLGPWDGSNPTYGGTTSVTGLTAIDGTRTALFFGSNGTGPFCYGKGTNNPDLHNQIDPADGEKWCYDPTNSSKGQHAYPYNFQLWAYDMKDFAEVKAGTTGKDPWEVIPYGVWQITLPFNTSTTTKWPGGAAYDPVTRRLFVVQREIDHIGCCYYGPIVHVFQINTAAPANPVTNVTIASNLASPQPPNTAITFTATATGGNAPVQYKWFTYDGCTWNFGNWTTSNQFVWTPTAHNANARVGVWAKSATNTTDAAEANASMVFAVAGGAGSVSSVSLASSHPSPQPVGTTIVWTATPTGGSGALSYKWLIYDGTAWTPVSNWSPSNSFTWRPAVPSGAYKVSVWVKHATNGTDAAEASAASSAFVITGS